MITGKFIEGEAKMESRILSWLVIFTIIIQVFWKNGMHKTITADKITLKYPTIVIKIGPLRKFLDLRTIKFISVQDIDEF